MDYEELNSLWIMQREQYQLWEDRLIRYAKQLRDYFEEKLSLPKKTWVIYDTKEEHRYVELVDFFNKNESKIKNPSNTSITPEGFLAFGISITFNHGLDTYPKQNIYIPIAIQYNEKRLEHAFFDTESNSVSEGWIVEKDDFYEKFTKKLHDYLSHDPHDGFDIKTNQIGFLA